MPAALRQPTDAFCTLQLIGRQPDYCLELMLVYSLAVIVAVLVPTLLLIAGYERHRETVKRYTPSPSNVTATVLILMGIAFVLGILGWSV